VHDAIQWCGHWLHEVGQTRRAGRLAQAADKRRHIKELLAPQVVSSHVASSSRGGGGGAPLQQLQSA
jgi:hypothetical protein